MTAALEAIALAVMALAALWVLWKTKWGYPDCSIPAVITYHKITDFELGGTWVSRRRFERHIASLLDSGFRFISEKDLIDTLGGYRESSREEILLTFDDGYDSFALEAAPVLENLSVPALVFLVSGSAGGCNEWELRLPGRRARHMDWGTVRELSERGFSFGSHGVTHRPLTRLPRDEALRELISSKEEIERHTGSEVLSFSYPFGRVDSRTADLAEEAGYRAAFTLYPPGKAGSADRFRIRREGVWVIDSSATLRVKVSRGRFFWLEDLKGRAVNAVADLSIILKKS